MSHYIKTSFTSNAQKYESVLTDVVVEIFSMAECLLQALGRVDLGQELFGDFRKVPYDVRVTRQDDVST